MSIVPTIALGIGVVVAGLGIGAFLSALQRNASMSPKAAPTVATMVVTPVPATTPDALALRTPVPHLVLSPTPAPTATAKPSPTAGAEATTATVAARATALPSAKPSARPTVSVTPQTVTMRGTGGALRTSPSPRPVVALARPTFAPSTVPPSASAAAATATFVAQAEATVRRYLDAVITGNDASAYAAFGTSPGDPNVRLTEAAFVDHSSRILSLRTTHADVTGATVGAEVSSAHGSYYVTYHLSRGPGGAVIDGHDYIRE